MTVTRHTGLSLLQHHDPQASTEELLDAHRAQLAALSLNHAHGLCHIHPCSCAAAPTHTLKTGPLGQPNSPAAVQR